MGAPTPKISRTAKVAYVLSPMVTGVEVAELGLEVTLTGPVSLGCQLFSAIGAKFKPLKPL